MNMMKAIQNFMARLFGHDAGQIPMLEAQGIIQNLVLKTNGPVRMPSTLEFKLLYDGIFSGIELNKTRIAFSFRMIDGNGREVTNASVQVVPTSESDPLTSTAQLVNAPVKFTASTGPAVNFFLDITGSLSNGFPSSIEIQCNPTIATPPIDSSLPV